MKEIYYLNKNDLPVIPTPHDCVIKEIRLEDQNLIFVFENDISNHDSARYYKSEAKSLIMTFHLESNIYDISFLQRKGHRFNRIFHKLGVYKEIDIYKKINRLTSLTSSSLEYLYHNVGYCSIIVKLWSKNSIILDITADYVELEWIVS